MKKNNSFPDVISRLQKILLGGLIFCPFALFAQEHLEGTYIGKTDPQQDNKEVIVFDKHGGFTHDFGSVHQEGVYGAGSYKVHNNTLILQYTDSSDLSYSGYYQKKEWVNNKDSAAVHIKVMSLDQQPLAGANALINTNGVAMNKKGEGILKVPVAKGEHFLEISHIGYKPQRIALEGNKHYSISIWLHPNTPKTILWGQIDTLKILKRTAETLMLQNQKGNTVQWTKQKTAD